MIVFKIVFFLVKRVQNWVKETRGWLVVALKALLADQELKRVIFLLRFKSFNEVLSHKNFLTTVFMVKELYG